MGSSNGKYKLTLQDIQHLSTYSGLSEEDIQRRFELFCKKYPKGKIPNEEYTSLLKNCYRQTNSAQLESHISRAYDMNGDGYIDFKEFLTVLYIFGGGEPQEKLTQVFRIFDFHDDGYLRKEEVQKIVRDMFHLLGRFDNPDNLDADTMAKAAFEQMDYLKNDIITKDEFMRACMGSDKIITMLAYRMLDVCMTDCG